MILKWCIWPLINIFFFSLDFLIIEASNVESSGLKSTGKLLLLLHVSCWAAGLTVRFLFNMLLCVISWMEILTYLRASLHRHQVVTAVLFPTENTHLYRNSFNPRGQLSRVAVVYRFICQWVVVIRFSDTEDAGKYQSWYCRLTRHFNIQEVPVSSHEVTINVLLSITDLL